MTTNKKILNILHTDDKTEVLNFCKSIMPPPQIKTITSKPSSLLDGYKLQDTPYGCNGDLIADDKQLVVISHTNPKWTKPSSTSWKENRVEIAKVIPKTSFDWKFKIDFYKLPTTSDWFIYSQLWNRDHDNVLSLVCLKSTTYPGKVLLRLDKKQNKKPTILWYKYFDIHQEHDINLVVTANGVSGTINGVNVGTHTLEVFTDKPQEIKYGLYWSGKIPYNQENRIVARYKF